MWLLCAFGSAIFAGLTAILAKCGLKKMDSTLATALRTIIVLVFSWIMVFLTGSYRPITEIPLQSLFFLTLSGLATGGSWLFYFHALQLGEVNKVAAIDKSSTILTMLLAALLLGEQISSIRMLDMLVIAVGTLLMIAPRKKGKGRSKSTAQSGWLLCAMLSALLASLTSILGKLGMQGIPSNLGTALRTIIVLIMAWVMVVISGKTHELQSIEPSSLVPLCLSGITTGISWLCYYRALQDGFASIVVPIDKLSILVTVAFSSFILHEPISKRSSFGLFLMVIGTLALLIN